MIVPAPPKKRIDQLLVERGLVPSRARAQALIKAGFVEVAGAIVSKAALEVEATADIRLTGETHGFVGRGGLKLDHALHHFGISVQGAICLDLGASTGGFTDVLLRQGAAKIYAVDVGHGQLHESLREHPQVVNLEGLHAKDLTRAQVPEDLDVITADVSFISLTKALPPALALARPGAALVALVKPQFEVGRGNLGKGGIVKDAVLREEALETVANFVESSGWQRRGQTRSPVTGGDGNVEYLLWAVKT